MFTNTNSACSSAFIMYVTKLSTCPNLMSKYIWLKGTVSPDYKLYLSKRGMKWIGLGRGYCSGQKMPESWGRHSEALGNLGSRNLEGGRIGERVEKGEVSLQATWDRGGWILSQQGGFQVSREGLERGGKGRKGESARGDKKQGECAMYIVICVHVYNECL
jgi:hypothetical protein